MMIATDVASEGINSEKETEYLAEQGLLKGNTNILEQKNANEADELEPIISAGNIKDDDDLLAYLLGGESKNVSKTSCRNSGITHKRIRFYQDFDFLQAAYRLLQESQPNYLPLEIEGRMITLTAPEDLNRRLGNPTQKNEMIFGATAIPQEAWPENNQFRLTDDVERVKLGITAARNTSGYWSKELLCSETHPIMQWLEERLLMQFARGEAPIITSRELADKELAFCFIGQVPSKAGTPLIVDAHAVRIRPGGDCEIAPLRETLAAAGFEQLANTQVPVRADIAEKFFIAAAVEASMEHLQAMEKQRQERVQNTGVKFVHGRRENIFLNDLFVYPDLRVLDETVESLEKITSNIPSKKILQYQSNILILGEEQSGKTSLAKRIFQDALQDGFLPVFIIDGADIKKNFKIHEEIPFLLSNIYEYKLNEECIKKSKSICIIDDFSSSKLNVQATNEFLRSLNSIFSYVILFAKETFRYSILDYEILHSYKKFEIANFGNVHLGKIIEKWVELDSDEETNEKQILSQTDELRRHIESLVGKNIVPAKPFYILLLLQSFEILNPNKIEVTTYAHCYEYLIYQCLKRIDITKGNKVEMYLNVLSELGGEILDSSSESLDENSLEDFFIKYSKKFLIDNQNKVIDNLVKSSILQKTENGIKFRYHYLFYFFAAKKLATSLHRGEEAMDKIKALVKVVHLEKASNIILFVTHHTKDPSVLNEILLSVMDLFSEEEEMTLETESLSFLQDFIKQIPELVLENRDVKEERLRRDIQKDIAEQELSQTNQRETEMEQEDFVVNVNKLFRSIEVCGQLFRNRLNSLEREHLEIIYEESASVSLRFLNIFRRFCEFSKKELIEKIRTISDENPKISNSKIVKKVESWYLGINYMVILAMLHKIAFSLGSYEGREIYSVVTQKNNKPSFQLIQMIIAMQFQESIDFKRVEKLHSDFSRNPVCDHFLKHIILYRCYMHYVGYSERQKLADILDLPLQEVQRADQLRKFSGSNKLEL